MNKKILTQIYIYPVKSLGGISLKESLVTDCGLMYDRRWMIIDANENYISQKTKPEMALISTDISNDKIILRHKLTSEQIEFGINETTSKKIKAKVLDDVVQVDHVNSNIDEWLSINLNIRCRLVFMPDDSVRYVDKNYSRNNENTSLSNGYPFLLIGQSSLDDLNTRLKKKIGFDRFRPNLVFSDGLPYEEDNWKSFEINGIKFYPVKPCPRCITITINQNTAERDNEPLTVLSEYRRYNNQVMFGQNVLHEGNSILKVGDEIENINPKA